MHEAQCTLVVRAHITHLLSASNRSAGRLVGITAAIDPQPALVCLLTDSAYEGDDIRAAALRRHLLLSRLHTQDESIPGG